MKKKMLIVEDQFIEANNLQMILEKSGYHVCTIARSVPVALEIVERERPDMVLLDIFLQGYQTGIDLAKVLKEKNIGFVYLSANSNKKTLEEAKVTRPYGFLVKPFREKELLVMLDIAWYLHEELMEIHGRKKENNTGIRGDEKENAFNNIIGESPEFRDILKMVSRVAPSDTSVLLLGESGTGKEVIAAAIHEHSKRRNKAFVVVNCAALASTLIESELFGHERGAFTGAVEKRTGKFEQANGGTIFLDEIGEMPLETQVKLLRVLQEKEIERLGGRNTIKTDVRVIASTNRNLEQEIASGRFRLDLFYRLNVFPITLPPLRNRRSDIPLLARHFLRNYSRVTGKSVDDISPVTLDRLLEYDWPGNIRELENLIERAVLLAKGNRIEEIALPFQTGKKAALPGSDAGTLKSIEENEKEHIITALVQCHGKISGEGGAAQLLNIHVSTLNAKIKKHAINKEHYYH
ncbi:sigma-54-dependent transcriptional regulator [Flavihumibacter solisilvae]|uniref:Fis family transcriptional regulator n=1 Tax=Flavihumibacter solisilvae TaxID=1349421 RepID=A0A0C1IIN6_9BACT|nr:sigma-54 dependent transcriptional regulator [Flavihumibacter solisilvae]KIC94040.1 Fis family transcriptional regulator [Flavihumibacter solisilvae]